MLRSKAKGLEPILRIGKGGLSSNTLAELNKIIKKRKLIKIRLLNSSLSKKNKKELIDEIVQKSNSQLIETVGNIVVIYREE